MIHRLIVCSISLVLVSSLGCGGGDDQKLPPLAKVSGNVSLDGAPMPQGQVRFVLEGQPGRTVEVKDGAFTGEAFTGKNRVEVVSEKDGPPHPMEQGKFLKVNVVDAKYSGMSSQLTADVPASGATGLKFEVTSAK
jgi:hypothetical protein